MRNFNNNVCLNYYSREGKAIACSFPVGIKPNAIPEMGWEDEDGKLHCQDTEYYAAEQLILPDWLKSQVIGFRHQSAKDHKPAQVVMFYSEMDREEIKEVYSLFNAS